MFAGIMASATSGTFTATFVETPFMRKTMLEPGEQASIRSLFRFSVPLSSLYFLREVGFTVAVLGSKDMSPNAQYGALLGATWATAAIHKMASLEAIRDKLPKDKTIPDFSKGISYVIRSMARGDIYTHPAFKVPFPMAANKWALGANFLHASCGINMFIFRLAYLATFKQAYLFAENMGSSVSRNGLFANKQLDNAKVEKKSTSQNQLRK
jgi:hypothetical protein